MSDELLQWCLDQLQLAPSAGLGLVTVSGDASFRKYYRLRLPDAGSVIVVHAPPDKEDNDAFVKVQQILTGRGVRVPELLAWDRERGFLLLSDFGDQLLLPLLKEESADRYYQQALETLLNLQSIESGEADLPLYDEPRLRAEMQLFPQWFIGDLLGYALSGGEQKLIEGLFARLVASAQEQPQVVVHRDYHSRNLMCLPDGDLGVIDFQDAVLGPVTYDVASLLRDCYVCWPDDRVQGWALAYRDNACARQLMTPVDDATFLRWFDWMGLQRHIKVLGIFARLSLRDGKPQYLEDLPLVVHYTLSVARRYREFAGFVDWFETVLEPLIQTQSWAQIRAVEPS